MSPLALWPSATSALARTVDHAEPVPEHGRDVHLAAKRE